MRLLSSLEAFNEDRSTRSLEELVAKRERERETVIIICCSKFMFLFFGLVAELSSTSYLGEILTDVEVIDEDADDSESRLI